MFRLFKRLNGYRCILNLGAVLMCIYIDVEYHKSSWYKENYDGGKKRVRNEGIAILYSNRTPIVGILHAYSMHISK